ncbi:hypothetical protein ACIHCQ_24740 [Streptomyces sp. NPDC052236]|uniref:hypothetical protein n=1 Tax=Streptomyces sp. NPDC052236 TaxID=3365686 RepID=UPI0037D2055B
MSESAHSDEELLRRRLHELAESESSPGSPPPVDALVARGRRTRHLRRAAAVCCATVLVAGGVGLGLWPTDDGKASSDYASSLKQTTLTPVPAPSGSGDRDLMASASQPLATGPAKPEELVRYRYDLSAVCDLKYAVFGGRTWELSQEGPQYAVSWVSKDARMSGYMTLTGKDTAVFDTDTPAVSPLTFHPISGDAPCLAKERDRVLSNEPAFPMGPPKPHLRSAYPHSLSKDCDLRYTTFGGRVWESEEAQSVGARASWPSMSPIAGYMTQLSADTARFESLADSKQTFTYRAVDKRGGC